MYGVLFFLLTPFLNLTRFCTSTDTISLNQSIRDNYGDKLVSSGEFFVLGFFSPGNSNKRYIGIWYHKVQEQTIVWVANRDNPINDTSGVLSIDKTGNLVVHNGNDSFPLWSTNVSVAAPASICSAQLLDSGNLVLLQGDDGKRVVAWQSFDYPTDTMLPFMKIGMDRRTGLNRFLTAWKSPDDPRIGECSLKMDLSGSPQLLLSKGSIWLWRTGPWNGLKWSGVSEMPTSNFIFNVSYIDNHDEVSLLYNLFNTSIFSRMVVNEFGIVQRLTWLEGNRRWVEIWSAPKDRCDSYNSCGSYGNCNPRDDGEFKCTCLPGFEPKVARDWSLRVASGGCVRKRKGQVCGNGEGFVRMTHSNIPYATMTHVNISSNLKECEEVCLKDCSCSGYTSVDIRGGGGGGSGCVTWHNQLIDTRVFSDGGQDIYIRVDAVELAQYSKSKGNHGKKLKVAIVVVSVAVVSFLIIFLAYWFVMKKSKGKRGMGNLSFSENELVESETSTDLPFFDLRTIVAATDNFSSANRLGQGGFGTVYKGRLHNGQEIAVKRLSKNSGQGIREFKNEVTLIAKLQHRNLVKLVGCCIQQEENMLIYEYLPNKSLDSFIFDEAKRSSMGWEKLFDIILGIARGMLYLHQDSRLRIIHRDLKASNVLLDAAMNPKISDFGLARIFGGDQIEANTNRVVGTYGYMSPEYAMKGLFSIKSDVFSFGVVVLEIICGRKNSSYDQENFQNLIGHVWDLWGKGESLGIVDSSLGGSYQTHQVLRCIHIALLCVQEHANDRPTMSAVVIMLCNETSLPLPKQPAFISRSSNNGPDSSLADVGACSINDITDTMVEGR
ncbi:G-type lectin S-receptor-like serine/threonine-protein kinase At1g11410 isoform X2 [Cornus florida]|uniref:G-type lectin S-receptor-like serine/threonine-protein kinase At1g11410 isoform X2 n=1 Tax=Cornus florida TaxID=4283 RepID=UPI00289D441F|nr:G-type lectin S-receptor-like serine/threonine-protein kinase At1g11410 isoform X2 [Cornus florida]